MTKPVCGLDLATGPDRTALFGPAVRGLQVGDRIVLRPQPRSVMHHVLEVVAVDTVSIGTYTRPSKGYRKHIRRQKAQNRK